MSYEIELRALVKTLPNVGDVNVGWNMKGSYPLVTIFPLSEQADYMFSGLNDFRKQDVQLDVWAADYQSARAITEALRELLSELPGGEFIKNVVIQSTEHTTDTDAPDALYRFTIRAFVFHQ